MKYRKKPVEVEAMRLTKKSLPEVLEWCEGYVSQFGESWGIEIDTLEGTMMASPGDWVIQGVKGEFYPCKPDIFKATYEPVEEAT